MCSSRGSGANSLPHSRIICSHGLVASRKQCLHQKRKVPFVLIWLVLSTGSFGALYNGFCHMPANTFHVAAYLQCLILKQILLLLHLMLFTVSTGFNAWPVCRGFLIHRFFYESSKTDQFRDGACVAIAWSNQEGVFSNTLLPQRFILRRIWRCLEVYRLLDLLPKSGVKARATAEPRKSLRTLLKTYQTFPV